MFYLKPVKSDHQDPSAFRGKKKGFYPSSCKVIWGGNTEFEMAESKHCGILQHEKSFSNHQSDNLCYSASVSREALKDVVWRGQCINRTACLSEGLTSIEMEHSLSCAFLCFYFELYSYLPTFVTLWGFFLDKMLVDSVNMHCISPV